MIQIFITMENNQTSATKHSFTYGMIIGVIMIALTLIYYVLDINTMDKSNRWTGWISSVIMFAGMTYAAVNYRNKQLGGYISYGKSFSIHFFTGLFSGIVSGLFMILFMSFVGAEFTQQVLDQAEEEMLKQNPNMTDEQIDMALKFTGWMLHPVSIGILGVLSAAFLGAIYGLIASIFVKKEDPNLPPVV